MSNPRKHVKYLLAVTSILTALVAARPSVAQGTLLWQQKPNGTANRGFGQALSVAVDSLGNVVAAGSTENTGTSVDFAVAKFASPLSLLKLRESRLVTSERVYAIQRFTIIGLPCDVLSQFFTDR